MLALILALAGGIGLMGRSRSACCRLQETRCFWPREDLTNPHPKSFDLFGTIGQLKKVPSGKFFGTFAHYVDASAVVS
jgi:hypothetical protein